MTRCGPFFSASNKTLIRESLNWKQVLINLVYDVVCDTGGTLTKRRSSLPLSDADHSVHQQGLLLHSAIFTYYNHSYLQGKKNEISTTEHLVTSFFFTKTDWISLFLLIQAVVLSHICLLFPVLSISKFLFPLQGAHLLWLRGEAT